MLTLTIEHKAETPLEEISGLIKQSYAKTRQSSPYERLKNQGLLGVINVCEINYGFNGWNPHIHSIIIAKSQEQAELSANALGNRYKRFLERESIIVNENTFDNRLIYDPNGLATYLSKNWYFENKNHLNPFQLARLGLKGDKLYARLFVECYDNCKNMKNAKISSSLKKLIYT